MKWRYTAGTAAKLLRVLQEREFEPVGSTRTTRVDVRVVAATNQDLRNGRTVNSAKTCISAEYFPISLPPLRERKTIFRRSWGTSSNSSRLPWTKNHRESSRPWKVTARTIEFYTSRMFPVTVGDTMFSTMVFVHGAANCWTKCPRTPEYRFSFPDGGREIGKISADNTSLRGIHSSGPFAAVLVGRCYDAKLHPRGRVLPTAQTRAPGAQRNSLAASPRISPISSRNKCHDPPSTKRPMCETNGTVKAPRFMSEEFAFEKASKVNAAQFTLTRFRLRRGLSS